MYNDPMGTRTPKIRKSYELSPAEDLALAKLLEAGYPFPSTSEVGVIRKMLRDVWKTVFPNESFPTNKEANAKHSNL